MRPCSPQAPPMTQVSIKPLFLLFTLSGFTGLIYQSLWSHYLKLFLGHAAFAQSFVLIMFMGGMALGAWLVSRSSAERRDLLVAYALIEALIGVVALVFHELFGVLTAFSLDTVIPSLGNPVAVEVWKLSLSAGLLLPQTVLLGMTFPLMSGAVIRRSPALAGHHLATLYFTNCIGAALGALASAFWLIGAYGLPGTMRLAGVANLLLAGAVLWLARGDQPRPTPVPVAPAGTASPAPVRLFMWAAFFTGAASFIYEIAWVRMLSLVLGSSFQAFELMLSAFITGLALGGLWIRKRIDRIADPVRFSGIVQLVMGSLALGTVFVYHYSFDWMVWLMGALRRNDDSYTLYNLGSHAISFAIMLPTTFMAGMTLPLFTHVLMRRGHGERAIGQIYAANTLGAIAGVLITVHLLMPQVGVKLAIIVGAATDIVLGGWLLRWSEHGRRRLESLVLLAAGLALAAVTARAATLDPARMSSGVFRHGVLSEEQVDIAYYRDGKTASIALRDYGAVVAITTNGKPDAGIQMDPMKRPRPDEWTMTLLGAVPLLMKPDARSVANVGFGSGLTGEVLLSHNGVQVLDTIEIEPAMVEAARGFVPRVRRVFEDPRSHIHIEDAKTFFARHQKRYDVIVSEPSNPWVSGVGNLFSVEFYRDIKRHLNPGGLLVQWMHIYELDDRLLYSVLAAMDGHFSDYAMFESSRGDLMIVATVEGRVPGLSAIPAEEKGLVKMLKLIGIESTSDIEARRFVTKRSLAPLLAASGAPANSDYYPVLQIDAPRARFASKAADGILRLMHAPVPVHEMLARQDRPFLDKPQYGTESDGIVRQSEALEIHGAMTRPGVSPLSVRNPEARLPLAMLRAGKPLCQAKPEAAMLTHLLWLAEVTLPHLGARQRGELWSNPRWAGCPTASMAPVVRERFALFDAVARRDAAAMLKLGEAVARGGEDTGADWRRYGMLAALLGARVLGKDAEADALWDALGERVLAPEKNESYVTYLRKWRGGPLSAR
jgi:spermidine synthase